MTREEAINRFQRMKKILAIPNSEAERTEEAIGLAIEALENKPTPCEKCVHVKSCRKVIILKNRTYKLIKYCSQGAERRED